MLRVTSQILKNQKSLVAINASRCLATSAKLNEAPPKPKAVVSNQSFVANFFRGKAEGSQVFPYPYNLTEEESETLSMVLDPVERFFSDVNDPFKNDETSDIDQKTLDALWELGAFSIQVPTDFGGMGANNTQYGRICQIVGANDLGVGICVGAHQSIGFKGILLYGTDEQKQKYLPRVTTGKEYAAFALTEPSSGSDVASIRTRAVLSPDGKHYILNGSKVWISNGGWANIMTAFAKTEVIDEKTGEKKDKITAFIVDRAFGGVSHGPPEKKMGIKCSNTAEVYFEDTKVPIENVLGGVGNGFKVAMNILNNGRFGMGASLSGTMAACIKKAAEHATQRVQFGKKIEEYGAIQEKLARMSMHQYATESMAFMISSNMDAGSTDYHLEAAISKIFASESAWFVCDEAIQILGGMGFMKQTGLERVLRDLRIFRIFEGSNDILRLFIALSGIQYAGGHLKELQRALKNPANNLGLIFKEVSKRAYRKAGIGGVDFTGQVDPSLADSAKLLAQSIDSFGQTVESLLTKYGKNIIDQQFILKCLADSAIDIYAMACVLSRCSRSIKLGLESVEHEKLLTKAWCTEAAERCIINGKKIHDSRYLSIYPQYQQISKNICAVQGVANSNPLNV